MRGPSAPIWRGGSIVDHAPGGSEFGIETVLVVHAHPGDEVFATGATVLAAKAAGHRVVLRQPRQRRPYGEAHVAGSPRHPAAQR
jgi:hypothetical protein